MCPVTSVPLCRWAVCGAIIAVVAGCHSTTPPDQMGAAQADLYSEAVALSQCESKNGYSSERCADQRGPYNRDLATFRANYAK